jgi:hypothetical protein
MTSVCSAKPRSSPHAARRHDHHAEHWHRGERHHVRRRGSVTPATSGVAPRGFSGIDRQKVGVWLPISSVASDHVGEGWHNTTNNWWLQIIGRIRDDVAPIVAEEQATAAYRATARAWEELSRDSTSSVVLSSIIATPGADPRQPIPPRRSEWNRRRGGIGATHWWPRRRLERGHQSVVRRGPARHRRALARAPRCPASSS